LFPQNLSQKSVKTRKIRVICVPFFPQNLSNAKKNPPDNQRIKTFFNKNENKFAFRRKLILSLHRICEKNPLIRRYEFDDIERK
jgi:hypothetical protein